MVLYAVPISHEVERKMAQMASCSGPGVPKRCACPRTSDDGRDLLADAQLVAAKLEPLAADWQWLDDIAGKFSEDFFQHGRNQP